MQLVLIFLFLFLHPSGDDDTITLTYALKAWPHIGQSWELNTPIQENTPAAMSVQEASQRPPSPVPLKTDAKPRPEIPPKPSSQTSSPPLGDRSSSTSLPGGKVKRIVNKFSQKESNEQGEKSTNGTAEVKAIKRSKRPPTVKPKPGRASLQLQLGNEGEKAPPLPLKRSRILQKQKETEGGEQEDGISATGGRSGTVGFTWVLVFLSAAFLFFCIYVFHYR